MWMKFWIIITLCTLELLFAIWFKNEISFISTISLKYISRIQWPCKFLRRISVSRSTVKSIAQKAAGLIFQWVWENCVLSEAIGKTYMASLIQ